MAIDNKRKLQLIEVYFSYYEQLINQAEIAVIPDTENDPNAAAAIPRFTVTIPEDGPDITVLTYDGTDVQSHNTTFTAPKGTAYTVSLGAPSGSRYMLTNTGGILLGDITIKPISYDEGARCAIIIDEPYGRDQIITTKKNGKDYLPLESYFTYPGDRADFRLYVPWTRKYDEGKLYTTSLPNIRKNTNMIYATPPVIRSDFDPTVAEVTIIQSDHQTITVTEVYDDGKNKDHTETFRCPINTRYKITAKGEHEGWKPGEINCVTVYGEKKVDTGIFDIDCRVSAEPATRLYAKIKITQQPHQTITVRVYDDDGKTYHDYTKEASVPVHNKFEVIVTPDAHYEAGNPNISKGRIPLDGLSISATAPKRLTANVTMRFPGHGTYYVNTYDDNGRVTRHNSNFTVDIGSRYEIISIPDVWYKYDFNVPVNGTVNDDMDINPKVSICTDYELNLTVGSGQQIGAGITALYGGVKNFGSMSKLYILDVFAGKEKTVRKSFPHKIQRIGEFEVAFWGSKSVKGLFKTVDVSVKIDGQWYYMLKKFPNDKFDKSGDVYVNTDNSDRDKIFKTFINNLGKKYPIRIHIDV